MRQKLINRFRYLWTWELLNAFIVIPAFILSIRPHISVGFATITGSLTFSALLIVGAAFAFIKYRDLKNRTNKIDNYKHSFRILRWLIPLLLFCVCVIVWLRSGDLRNGDIIFGIIFILLAILEYINYFHIQLMYDNATDIAYLFKHRKLKYGVIAREFDW